MSSLPYGSGSNGTGRFHDFWLRRCKRDSRLSATICRRHFPDWRRATIVTIYASFCTVGTRGSACRCANIPYGETPSPLAYSCRPIRKLVASDSEYKAVHSEHGEFASHLARPDPTSTFRGVRHTRSLLPLVIRPAAADRAPSAREVTCQGLAMGITRGRRNMDDREWARFKFMAFGRPGPGRNDYAMQCALAWPGIPGTIRSETALRFRFMAAGRPS